MTRDPKLDAIVAASPLLQEISVKANAVIWGMLGSIFLIAAVFAPAPPEERVAKLVSTVFGIALVAGAGTVTEAHALELIERATAQSRASA
jgi:hypothetical protein